MITIQTSPVFSKESDEEEVQTQGLLDKVPANSDGSRWRLSEHQTETYKALTNSSGPEIVINTAMTGDGKSLAAYLPVLVDIGCHAFGMYPTNELSRDQARQFQNYMTHFRQQFPYCSLWGAELTRLAEEHNFTYRASALQERFNNHNVILTNPDIFNLVMNYRYRSGIFTPSELPYSLCTNFDYFIFDEFHLFSTPQVVSVLTAMLYMLESGQHHKFLFSSATPNSLLLQMAQRSGLRYEVIEGSYTNQAQNGYRPVLHPTQLQFHQLREKQSVEEWLKGYLPEIILFWQSQSPRPKGAIIVNSVVSARRIAQMLAIELAKHGITVGENTGLTDAERRSVSLQKDIVVGTSTIDVGVDFNINFLVFESTNAGTFLQRFGRLGRHKMDEPAFAHYHAHALISGKTPWVYARIEEELRQQGVTDGGEADRPTQLAKAIHATFPEETDFANYAKRWGVIQAAHVISVLENNKNQDAYTQLANRLTQRYEQLFALSNIYSALKRYWYLADKKQASERTPILDEIIAFRGTSPFQVGCWDTTVDPDAFLTYNLFPLIQSSDYVVDSLENFQQAMEQKALNTDGKSEADLKYVMKGKGDKPLILKILEYNEEREWLKLRATDDLSLWSDQVFVLHNLAIDEPRSLALGAVNQVLSRQAVVCYATKRWNIRELRRMLKLPSHFPLYTAVDMHRNREYVLTFGKPALMLEAQLLGWRKKDVEEEPIFC
jgi:CRISPR-associated endonuclease/helicase Cas3